MLLGFVHFFFRHFRLYYADAFSTIRRRFNDVLLYLEKKLLVVYECYEKKNL